VLAVPGLSIRTAVAFASGSTFVYFLQPVLDNTVVASLFLLSLATARPVVARLAADFFPMTDDIAKPRGSSVSSGISPCCKPPSRSARQL